MSQERGKSKRKSTSTGRGSIRIENVEKLILEDNSKKQIANQMSTGKSKMKSKLMHSSQKISSYEGVEKQMSDESECDTESQASCEEGSECGETPSEGDQGLLKTATSSANKRQQISEKDGLEGPLCKAVKTDPTDYDSKDDSADPVELYLAAENAESLMKAGNFSKAHTCLLPVVDTVGDFRFKLLLAECKFRLGLPVKQQAIGSCAEFISANSSFTWKKVHEITTQWIEKPPKLGKAIVLLASYASVLAKRSGAESQNQAVYDIGSCIKSFSDAVRKIPGKTKDANSEQHRKPKIGGKYSQTPRSKKFGKWCPSLELICPMMETMFGNLQSLTDADKIKAAKSEAYALNWMSSAAYHVQQRGKGVEYSQEGVNLSKKRCGAKYFEQQSYANLLHNLGHGIAMQGKVSKGLKYIEESLKHKQTYVKYGSDDEKQRAIDFAEDSKKYWKNILSEADT